MSAHETSPHATGYEDAITRRIAGLESRIADLEADLVRERAQSAGLVADNAALRVRATEAGAALASGLRARAIGLTLIVLALLVAGWAIVVRAR